MGKGDTKIGMQFEVGGASAATKTVQDVYSSQASAMKKANNAEEAEARKRANAAKQLDKQRQKAKQAIAIAEYQAEAAANKSKLESVVLLERQRRQAKLQNLLEEERDRKRIEREALADRKRIEREKTRDAKMAARERTRIAAAEAKEQARMEKQQGAMGKLMGRGMWGAAMGIAGYAGVAGISNIITGVVQGMKDIAEQGSALEKAITPLVSLGDNVSKMGEMRKEVIGLGATMGRDNQDIANFLESLNSLSNTMAPSTLRDIKRESLQLSELAGGDLQTNMRMLAKTNESYGSSFETINQAQNKLFRIQQDADVPMEEMAYRMPELMASAKQLGFSFDEVGAGVIATTVALGRSEGAFTGLRNVFAALEEAPKKGIELQGTMVEQLRQLKDAADQGKISLLELFGRDPLAAGGALLSKIDSVRSNIDMLSNMGPEGDLVGQNLEQKYKDPKFVKARIYDLDKALMANSANIAQGAGTDNFLTKAMERYRTGYLAGAEFAGDTPGFAGFSGIAGMLGVDSVLEQGERVRLENTSEGSPLRQKLLKKQFDDQKERDEMAIWRTGQYYTFDEKQQKNVLSPEVRAIRNRQFEPDGAGGSQPSLEKSLDLASKMDESNRILRDIRDGLLPSKLGGVKSGSSLNTNNGETL
jgi:hypothetical protein